MRVLLCLFMLCASLILSAGLASAQTKSLKLYYIHTGEKADIVYKKNGQYIASGLKKINWHLRDWRRNEPTKMDPKLLDLVWEAYRQSGSKGYITVISGYRSPASNSMLRQRGRGVAKNSQHTLGKALDFYLPDVKLSKLREIGLKLQVGGVGYYPTSGSPFVHLDVGSVRHWPRMTRKELAAVFPDDKTIHIPSNGKPLAKYEQTVTAYNARSASGKLVPESRPTEKQLTFFQRLAQGTKEDEVDDEGNESAPTPRAVATTTSVPAPEQAPEPTPEPAPEPVTPEPVIAVRETQFASLPSQIPVPILAPRNSGLENGSAIAQVIASAPQTEVAAEVPKEAVVEPEQSTQLASLNIPVPQRRPEAETRLAALEPANAGTSEEPANVLALSEPEAANNNDTRIAVLSPQEIEDLRAMARPTTSEVAMEAPAGSQPETVLASLDASRIPAKSNIPVPVKRVGLPEAVDVSTPAAPSIETSANATVAPDAVTGIEPGTRSSGRIAIPSRNPQQSVEDEKPIVLASLPVPARSPRTAQIIQPEPAVQPAAAEKEPETKSLQARTISLDRYSAPEENTASIGQWALSSESTIADLADVQAPAYGRNVIRQVPGTILVQSFTPQPFGPGKNNFKGKAVTAMRFARLQIQ